MVDQYASKDYNRDASAKGPFITPENVDKLARIITTLKTANTYGLGISTAAPSVGAIPVMTP